VREVVGANERHVISNEIYKPGPGRIATPSGVPLTQRTLQDLVDVGFDPVALEDQALRSAWA
jgi:hypothetical protein